MRARARLALLSVLASAAMGGCGLGLAIPPIGPPPTPTGTILVDLPPGEREAAHLALDHANHDPATQLNGLELVAQDLDGSSPTAADPAARAALFHDLIDGSGSIQYLGMVGPQNRQEAQALMPIASRREFPIVSPSLTSDCLTQTQVYCRSGEPAMLYPKGSVNHAKGIQFFFRDATTESAEGPAAADYAYQTLGRRTAFLVGDATALSAELISGFTDRFVAEGGTVGGSATVGGSSGTGVAASDVQKAHADMVFFAGSGADDAAAARTAAVRGGAGTFIAGPGVEGSSAFITALGKDAEGSYAISPEPDPVYSAQAQGAASDYVQELAARYPKLAPTGYGLNAYLAMLALVHAVANASTTSSGQSATRPGPGEVLTALGGAGITGQSIVVDAGDNYGRISFDSDGDTIDKVLTMHEVTGGRWQMHEQITFAG